MKVAIACLMIWACMSALPAWSQVVVWSGSGSVASVEDAENFLPDDIQVGDPVTMELRYDASDATVNIIKETRKHYRFPTGQLMLTITVGGHVWSHTSLENDEVVVMDNDKKNDLLSTSIQDPNAAYAIPNATNELYFTIRDRTAPYSMLASADLPVSSSQVELAAVTSATCTVVSWVNESYWQIGANLNEFMFGSTVAVEQVSWSAVKALFDAK